MTERRRFNGRERLALYRLAGGHCEDCGRPLPRGWHADHKIPYSKSGPTDVINGAALCPPCNTKKGNTIMNPDRPWQQRFLAHFATSDDNPYLLVACPATGKTLATIAAAMGYRHVVVVVPQRDVKDAWRKAFSKEAARTSHDLTVDGTPIAAHASVIVITYQGLPRWVPELRDWLASERSLLVLDEIHHGGEAQDYRDEPPVWGPAAEELAAKATRTLLLTGTPLRTGGDRIVLVRYDANDEPWPHMRYGFAEAWAEDPCPIRRIRFMGHDADVEWSRVDGDGAATLSKMGEKEDEVAALRSALEPTGAFVADVLADIKSEMEERRKVRPRAGALIACRNQDHAKEVAAVMRNAGMGDLALVVSDDDTARDAIARFRDGDTTYLVAVRMISEGVDIPRLEVLAHFTPTRSRLFIHQLIGRVLRLIPGEEHVEAVVHYPMSWTISQEIAAIEEALTYTVHSPEEHEGGGGGPSTFIWGTATSAVQAEVSGSFGTIDRGRIDALRVGVPSLDEDQAVDVARFLLRDGTLGQVDPIPRTRVTLDPQAELTALRRERNNQAQSLAGLMAKLGQGTYEECAKRVNGTLRSAFDGRDPARLSADELREALRLIQRWRDGLG